MSRLDTLPREAQIEAHKIFDKRQKDLAEYHSEMANPETKLTKQDFDDWFNLILDIAKTKTNKILSKYPE